ncbi:MAG: hypothetical protein HY202_04815 [Nitrospirae bacterium]|nr:hypothetical protein [Nitrospirota bacterium]
MATKLHKKDSVKKGARRVEAWIYTVINPLIESLKIESTFLEDKNWTYRYTTNNLEFIFPLEQYLGSAFLPNFEDFLKAHPRIEQRRKKHEDLRAALSEHCRLVFNHLIDLQDFENKVNSSLKRYEHESQQEYPGGAVPRGDFKKLVAQYVLNQIKELPEHYTTSKFWSSFGREFLEFRAYTGFGELETSGDRLKEEDDSLVSALEKLRFRLCKEYDVPAAPVFRESSINWESR